MSGAAGASRDEFTVPFKHVHALLPSVLSLLPSPSIVRGAPRAAGADRKNADLAMADNAAADGSVQLNRAFHMLSSASVARHAFCINYIVAYPLARHMVEDLAQPLLPRACALFYVCMDILRRRVMLLGDSRAVSVGGLLFNVKRCAGSEVPLLTLMHAFRDYDCPVFNTDAIDFKNRQWKGLLPDLYTNDLWQAAKAWCDKGKRLPMVQLLRVHDILARLQPGSTPEEKQRALTLLAKLVIDELYRWTAVLLRSRRALKNNVQVLVLPSHRLRDDDDEFALSDALERQVSRPADTLPSVNDVKTLTPHQLLRTYFDPSLCPPALHALPQLPGWRNMVKERIRNQHAEPQEDDLLQQLRSLVSGGRWNLPLINMMAAIAGSSLFDADEVAGALVQELRQRGAKYLPRVNANRPMPSDDKKKSLMMCCQFIDADQQQPVAALPRRQIDIDLQAIRGRASHEAGADAVAAWKAESALLTNQGTKFHGNTLLALLCFLARDDYDKATAAGGGSSAVQLGQLASHPYYGLAKRVLQQRSQVWMFVKAKSFLSRQASNFKRRIRPEWVVRSAELAKNQAAKEKALALAAEWVCNDSDMTVQKKLYDQLNRTFRDWLRDSQADGTVACFCFIFAVYYFRFIAMSAVLQERWLMSPSAMMSPTQRQAMILPATNQKTYSSPLLRHLTTKLTFRQANAKAENRAVHACGLRTGNRSVATLFASSKNVSASRIRAESTAVFHCRSRCIAVAVFRTRHQNPGPRRVTGTFSPLLTLIRTTTLLATTSL